MLRDSLIGISEASQFLVVSEATLRLWTDEGRLKAFITPGGHRRYSRAELKRFMNSHQKPLGVRDMVTELEGTANLHREISRTLINDSQWYKNLDSKSQEHLGELGHRFLHLIIRYVSKPSNRQESIQLARDVGRDFGKTLAKLGLPLTDCVEAFLSHRNPVVEATVHLMRKRKPVTGRVVEAIPLTTHIIDEALVALITAHQQYQNEFQSGVKEELSGDIDI